MGAVKDMLMDVEEFVYDFYDKEGNLLKSEAFIVDAAIQKFGSTFGSYAEEVLEGPSDMEPHWDFNKSVSENLLGFELEDGKIPF
jgi:hypothetical protein